jgi:two-component system, NtrC family, response regulator AtoC
VPQNNNIIIIEPDQGVARVLISLLKDLGYLNCCPLEEDANIFQMNTIKPALAVLGPSLKKETCFKNIHKLKILDPLVPILTSSPECLPVAPGFSAFEGVHFIKPEPDKDTLSGVIEAALQWRGGNKIQKDLPVIIGQSPEIMTVRQKIRNVADKDVTVLVTGETGTGKELVARSLHYKSQRVGRPLVKVDCTSMPDELLESEVFGFQKGAFTDAYRDKPGRLEMAHGGTLFIDEIGDISLSLQVKFMQVFEEKEFSRLGGTTDKVIDARVVVATNAKLWEKVQKGTFRKDLYYRLNVMQIDVPALRKRREDIPLLIHYFQNKYCFEYKKEPLAIPSAVQSLLNAYSWPGNIRELENIVRRAIAVSDWDFVVEELKLREEESELEPDAMETVDPYAPSLSRDQLTKLIKENDFSLKKISKAYLSMAERDVILKVLRNTHWNRKKAAELLDVSYKTLINRIEELNLRPYE